MKTYPLPRRFLYAELLLYSLIGTLMIFAWIPAVISLVTYGSVFKSALRAAFFLNLTAVTLIVFIMFIKKELRSVLFFITEEYVGYRTASRDRKLRISSITSITLLRFPLGGGVAVVESPDGSLGIPLFVTGCPDLFARLREYRTAGDSGTSTETDWESLMLHSTRSEVVIRRSLRVFPLLLAACSAALPLNVFAGAVYWDMSLVPLMLWVVAGSIFPLATYGGADMLLRLQTARSGKTPPSPATTKKEDRILVRAAVAGGMLFLMCGILYRAIVS